MKIKVKCASCGKTLAVTEKFAGKRIKCPSCSGAIVVPRESVVRAELSSSDDPPSQTTISSSSSNAPVPHVSSPMKVVANVANVAGNYEYPPYLDVEGLRDPKLDSIPELASFQKTLPGEIVVGQYRTRVMKPTGLWRQILICVIIYPLILLIPFVVAAFYSRRRGHTYLYLTNRRLVVLELDKGVFGRSQTVLNYGVESISGFTLIAQHGIKKFLGLFTTREKKTFYIKVTTNTFDSFELGSSGVVNSLFSPGRDAVNLCSELDSLLLAVKSGDTTATQLSGGA